MKRVLPLMSLGCLILATMAFILIDRPTPGQPVESKKAKTVVGRWERMFPRGVWIWDIRADGTFSVSAKGKAFADGQYRVRNGIYDINDANCNVNYHGQYRFDFFAEDSVRFAVVADTCSQRRGGIDGIDWKRSR